MSCGAGCNGGPSRFSPEHKMVWKAQNNSGCSCSSSGLNDCDKPSFAKEGSPLWEWEQIYGKLVTRITKTQDENGHETVLIEKIPCPKPVETNSRYGCCSFTYRVNR
jgi:hypothetical protein